MSELLVTNARIKTMNMNQPDASTMLVRDGRIVAVGGPEIAQISSVTAGRQEIDAAGRVVIPGFVDAHTHIELASLARQRWTGVRALPLAEMMAVVRDRASQSESGEWLVFQGTFDDEVPTRQLLDDASPNNPVVVRLSMHHLVANSLALRLAGIDRTFTRTARGVRVHRDHAGEPTGEILEGFDLFPIPGESIDNTAERLREEIQHSFVRNGVTTIGEIPFSDTGIRAYNLLSESGRLNARIGLVPTLRPGLHPLIDDVESWIRSGASTGFGNSKLWLNGIKIFMDGAGPMAYRWSQLEGDLRSDPLTWGMTTHEVPDLVDVLVQAYRAGIQPWIHAIGDAAQDMVVSAIGQALRLADASPDHRTRIEHYGNEYHKLEVTEKLVDFGIIPVPTAAFLHFDDGSGVFAYQSMKRAGLITPGNSDNAGTQPFATNPWFGIGKMLTRTNRHGVTILPEESLSLEDAIRAYTYESAFAMHMEDHIGSLEVGKYADFTLLNVEDLAEVGTNIEEITATGVFVDGEQVHAA